VTSPAVLVYDAHHAWSRSGAPTALEQFSKIVQRLFAHFFAIFVVHEENDISRCRFEFGADIVSSGEIARVQNRNCSAIVKAVIAPPVFSIRGCVEYNRHEFGKQCCH
jgi:hypothetical protein